MSGLCDSHCTDPLTAATVTGRLTLGELLEFVERQHSGHVLCRRGRRCCRGRTRLHLFPPSSGGAIDSVIMGFPDMYGRMMGKRFDADFFLDSAAKDGTHACDYLLASDMEMVPIPVRVTTHKCNGSCVK